MGLKRAKVGHFWIQPATQGKHPGIHNSVKGTKKAPGGAGALKFARQVVRSVPGDDRATEAVIDARCDHIDVLMDRVGAEYIAGRDVGQNAV